jgi:hypothetical protein
MFYAGGGAKFYDLAYVSIGTDAVFFYFLIIIIDIINDIHSSDYFKSANLDSSPISKSFKLKSHLFYLPISEVILLVEVINFINLFYLSFLNAGYLDSSICLISSYFRNRDSLLNYFMLRFFYHYSLL